MGKTKSSPNGLSPAVAGQTRRFRGPCIVIVAVLAFGAYANNLGNGFAMDDGYTIVGNTDIRDFSNLPNAMARAVGSQSTNAYERSIGSQFWRPVATLSYAVDYQLWGLRPLGYHLTSNALHTLVSVLLLLLLLHWTGPWPALLAAAWYAVHPVHSEAVDLATYRTELLATAACVAALLLHAHRQRNPWTITWICVLYAIGLGAKETAVTLPAWLLAAQWLLSPGQRQSQAQNSTMTANNHIDSPSPQALGTPRDSPRPSLALALGLVLAAWLAARQALALQPSPVQFFAGLSPWQVACSVLKIYPTYIHLLLWPQPLTPFYDWTVLPPAASLADPLALWGLGLLAATLTLALRFSRTKPFIALGLSWWLLGLLPFCQIIRLPVGAAERFLYFPSVGIALCLAGIIEHFQLHVGQIQRRIGLAVAIALLVVLTGVTVLRNRDWHDDLTLQQAAARDFPHSFNAHHVLGQLYLKAGRHLEAERQLRQAEALLPGIGQNGLWLARALLGQGQFEQAELVLRTIAEDEPDRLELLDKATRRRR